MGAVRGDFLRGKQSLGTLIAGDFGSGKSHLLEYFKHIALAENFVCSKIVISKETPLYNQAKVYRAAIESATVPGRRGSALIEILPLASILEVLLTLSFTNGLTQPISELVRDLARQFISMNMQQGMTK